MRKSKPKFKVGDLAKFTHKYNEWNFDHSDSVYAVAGQVQIRTLEELLDYGLHRYSFSAKMDIFALIEGDNGYTDDDFAYKVLAFNELGFGIHYVSPENLEKL